MFGRKRTTDNSSFVFTKKKGLAMLGSLLSLVPLLLLFAPLYLSAYGEGEEVTYAYTSFFESSRHLPGTVHPVAMWILMGIYLALTALAEFLLIRSVYANPMAGDKEDKFFVFGFFTFIGASTFLAMTMVGLQSFIPMGIAIALIFVGVGILVYHYKNLSSI